MKKTILALGIAAAMLSMSACNGSSSSTGDSNDSLSTIMGQFNGASLNQSYNQLPPEMKAKYDKEQMLKGFEAVIMNDTTKMAYVTGMSMAVQLWGQISQLEENGIHVDRKALFDAYKKAFLADSVPDMMQIQSAYQTIMSAAQNKMMENMQVKAEAERKAKENSPEAKKNLADGQAYVAKQKQADPSIQTTPSGLSYKVITEGTGAQPQDNSIVKVNYTGRLIDGKEFDSTGDRGPATFGVKQVVPGFGEALKLMKKGGKYRIYIPGNLGYGVDGTPDGTIPSNAMLIFDVELVDVEQPASAN